MRIVLFAITFTLLTVTTGMSKTYQFVAVEKLAPATVASKVLPQIYEKLGLEIIVHYLPAKRAEFEANSGRRDGESARIWEYGEGLTELIRVPTPYYAFESVAFVRKNSGVTITSVEDLAKYRLAIIRGIKYSQKATQKLPNVDVVNNPEVMMQLLHNGRVDAAITTIQSGMEITQRLGYTNITHIPVPLTKHMVYNYLHKKHADLVPHVDAAIREMKASGELDAHICDVEVSVGLRTSCP